MNHSAFDITVTAQVLAEFNATLAGFTFAVLILFAERFINKKTSKAKNNIIAHTLTVLVLTFFNHLAVAVGWSLVAGDNSLNSPHPYILAFFAALNLFTSTVLTIENIVLVFDSINIEGILKIARLILAFSIVTGIIFISIITITLLMVQNKTDFLTTLHNNFIFFIWYICFIVTPPVIGFLINTKRSSSQKTINSIVFATIWLSGIVISAIAFGHAFVSNSNYLSDTSILIGVLISSALVGLSIVFLPNGKIPKKLSNKKSSK